MAQASGSVVCRVASQECQWHESRAGLGDDGSWAVDGQAVGAEATSKAALKYESSTSSSI